jgi:hypothetical protein
MARRELLGYKQFTSPSSSKIRLSSWIGERQLLLSEGDNVHVKKE